MKTISECGSLVTKDKSGKITAIDPLTVMINALSRDKYKQIITTVEKYYELKPVIQRDISIN
jgi:hypothetical protein